MRHTEQKTGQTSAALEDVLILDFSHVLSGPYCTMMLGDLGATVIKIEHPTRGDDTRHFGPPSIAGESAYYLGLNRNKYSVQLDFATPEGRNEFLTLAKRATILVENFRPGTLERKGLGYDTLRELNPGLIYCSISGYGHTGPRRMQPGYDLIAEAESGLMSINGEIEGEPLQFATPIVDVTAGMYACLAILAALRVRDRTGKGQQIDISLQEAAVTLLSEVGSGHLISGEEAQRYGNGHPTIVPYQAFATRDGHMVIACGTDKLFAALCQIVGNEDLASDPRFATNPQRVRHRTELIPLLQEALARETGAHWLAKLRAAGIPCGPIRSVREALQDEQFLARGLIWECEHPTAGPIKLIGSPLHLSTTPPRLYKVPPLLGEDSKLIKDFTEEAY